MWIAMLFLQLRCVLRSVNCVDVCQSKGELGSALLVHRSRLFDAFSRILDDTCPGMAGANTVSAATTSCRFLVRPTCRVVLTVPLGAAACPRIRIRRACDPS